MENKQPKIPEGQWAVNENDKEVIRKFGRELSKFVFEYARANMIESKFFHLKFVAGAFQYFMDLQSQKAKVVGDDILATQDSIDRYGLGAVLTEPFEKIVIEVPPTTPKVEGETVAEEKKEEALPESPVVEAAA